MFHSHLTKEKATALLEHVAEGCGVRQTERLVGVHRDTVTRYIRKAGDHAKAAHDELVALSPPHDRGSVR
jgi:LacI family transcriptional regulator